MRKSHLMLAAILLSAPAVAQQLKVTLGTPEPPPIAGMSLEQANALLNSKGWKGPVIIDFRDEHGRQSSSEYHKCWGDDPSVIGVSPSSVMAELPLSTRSRRPRRPTATATHAPRADLGFNASKVSEPSQYTKGTKRRVVRMYSIYRSLKARRSSCSSLRARRSPTTMTAASATAEEVLGSQAALPAAMRSNAR